MYDYGSDVRNTGAMLITLVQPYKDTSYSIITSCSPSYNTYRCMATGTYRVSNGSFEMNAYGWGENDRVRYISWKTEGYIA